MINIVTGFGTQNPITKIGLYGTKPNPASPGDLMEADLGAASSGGAVAKQSLTWLTDGEITSDIVFYNVQGDTVNEVRFYDTDDNLVLRYTFSSGYVFNNDGTLTIDSINLRF